MTEHNDDRWGRCHDPDLLAQIMESYPHACTFDEARLGASCSYPLWNLRRDASGTWSTRFGPDVNDAHRMVCGAPTHRTEPPYCDRCMKMAGTGAYRRATVDAATVQRRLSAARIKRNANLLGMSEGTTR